MASDLLKAIQETANGLYRAGVMDESTMRKINHLLLELEETSKEAEKEEANSLVKKGILPSSD